MISVCKLRVLFSDSALTKVKRDDATVRNIMLQVDYGLLSYEQALEQCVVALSRQKEGVVDSAHSLSCDKDTVSRVVLLQEISINNCLVECPGTGN